MREGRTRTVGCNFQACSTYWFLQLDIKWLLNFGEILFSVLIEF